MAPKVRWHFTAMEAMNHPSAEVRRQWVEFLSRQEDKSQDGFWFEPRRNG